MNEEKERINMPTDEQMKLAEFMTTVRDYANAKQFNEDMAEAQQYKQQKMINQRKPKVITEEVLQLATDRLLKYKSSKASLDTRIVENEQYFKQRHWEGVNSLRPTPWLWNTIMSKHADMMDGYPEPNTLAKAKDDKQEAEMLSSILPSIFEACNFKKTYNDVTLYKLLKGTGCYGITWDNSLNNGDGDISIKKVDILNLFWEPGINDIQQSKEVFLTTLIDRDVIASIYPDIADNLNGGDTINATKYRFDDTVDVSDKVVLVDWYYKKKSNNRTVLHYVKYVNNTVLYSSEDDYDVLTEAVINPLDGQQVIDDAGNVAEKPTSIPMAERGWYDHGMYPFVFDPLFTVEGSPCGYSFIDIFKHTQTDLDMLNDSIIRNALLSSKPRYFVRSDGSINEEEFADLSNDIVHVDGASVGADEIRLIEVPNLPGNVLSAQAEKINELKDTSANRDANNGSASSGVTAASAIAALQESAGKVSRDILANTYNAYKQIVYQVIELIRQFYDRTRQFRITGQTGQEEYVEYSNANIKPQNLGNEYGVELGYRIPQFDIEVHTQAQTNYTKLSQNELALQLYSANLFNPANADQALATIEMMDFKGKSDVIARISNNKTLMDVVQQLGQISITLASKYEPQLAQSLQASLGGIVGGMPQQQNVDTTIDDGSKSSSIVDKAREQAQQATQIS